MAEQESVYLWSVTALTNGAADPAINFAEGQLPGTLNNSNRGVMAAIARDVTDTHGRLATSGSANAYTLTITGRQTPLATGHCLSFKASFSNTGAATLAVTNADAVALGTKAIRGPGDVALVSGQIVTNGRYDVQYDATANGAAGAWILLNPTILGMASVTNTLGSNVALNNTANYFDGPSCAQGTSGTWLASGVVTLTDSGTAPINFSIKLWDGTTVMASTAVTLNVASGDINCAISGIIASPAGNIRISVKDASHTTGAIAFNDSGNSKDSTLTVTRVA